MPSVVDARLLSRLDRKIAIHALHEGDPLEPVCPYALLEKVNWWYGLLATAVLAVMQRWQEGSVFYDIALQAKLREPEWTAENRWAIVHEWAHIFCRHRGDLFVLWRQRGPDLFGQWVDDWQERQCDAIAAYVLVRREALWELRDRPDSEIARILDVPVSLVRRRWYIWSRYGK